MSRKIISKLIPLILAFALMFAFSAWVRADEGPITSDINRIGQSE